MNLTQYQIQFIIRSVISQLGASNGQATNREMHTRIADRLGIPPGPGRAAMWTYINQGRALMAAGQDVQTAPPGTPPAPPTPPDRGSQGNVEQYVYRVAVDMMDPNTLTIGSWMVEVYSSNPLSAADLRDRALAMIMADPTRDGRYSDRVATGDPSLYDTRVVTAGVIR